MEDHRAVHASVWSPLLVPVFRALWIASLAANLGVWMQNVGGVWLMTTLTPSPVFIALMQTATSLPVFLLGLPSGALADIVDRRRLLMVGLAIMLMAVSILGVLTLLGVTTPWSLLVLTFVLGLGTALNQPVWQAIMPGLVPRQDRKSTRLNSSHVEISYAVFCLKKKKPTTNKPHNTQTTKHQKTRKNKQRQK